MMLMASNHRGRRKDYEVMMAGSKSKQKLWAGSSVILWRSLSVSEKRTSMAVVLLMGRPPMRHHSIASSHSLSLLFFLAVLLLV